MVGREQAVLADDGLKPWRDGTGCCRSDQFHCVALVFVAGALPRISKILHGLTYSRDSELFGHASENFHHFGMGVRVFVSVQMRRFDSCGADFFDLRAHFAVDGFGSD